ncbi:Rieske 2Fe-2S domain-containing protein [Gordonia sp. NPDC127522]|uniref:Rieske 2Fe-2S domain-containing protein n=1 Tax=Gordonia sp. NPDC127522 TaxID=3345390 RepID=UPI0036395FD9
MVQNHATAAEDSGDIRYIEAAPNPTRFARGWHCLGPVKEFDDGKPHQINAFGTSLVAFADSKGTIRILDAYCRHLGGNLADGTVKGDAIACPFHGWEWGANGRCKNIPYARRVPPLAKTRRWHTTQLHGHLFVWNDPQGNPPIESEAIPEIAEYSSGEYTDWVWHRVVIDGSNCREIVDNVVDMAHFFYIHYTFPLYFITIFEDHVARQVMHARARDDVSVGTNYNENNVLYNDASYFGPSYMISKAFHTEEMDKPSTFLINCHYPVSENSFVLQWGVSIRKPPGMSPEETDAFARVQADGVTAGFMQDVVIWQNKAKIDNPLLSEEDGPVYQLRRWYQQFYVDVDDVQEDMTNRFEFEIDTTRAVQSWEAEVAENIANGHYIITE